MKRTKVKKSLCITLLMCLLITMVTACKKEGNDVSGDGATNVTLDVLANLDRESITKDGDYVNFNVNTEDGKQIRFQGINIEVTEEGISMGAGAILCSLDYMGLITNFLMYGEAPGCWISFGPAYGDSASVDNVKELHMGFAHAVDLDGELDMDMDIYETGFFALLAKGNAKDMLITQLNISYDTSVKQVLYSELDKNSESAQIVANYPVEWSTIGKIDENNLAEIKMAEPGSITSDIIAGIDHSSIVQKGDSTFFSSVMSDGEVVRFEGKNITIDEDGIKIGLYSSVTSLDAVGKIYKYTAQIKDAEHYEAQSEEDGSQSYSTNMDVGYGYTYSADKLSVESADQVHTFGYGALSPMDWNRGASISLAYMEPNFIYFSGSEYNEEEFVVTSLCVGYNPEERVTGVKGASFLTEMTGAYLEGDLYNAGKENVGGFGFYLILEPDTPYADREDEHTCIYYVPETFYQVGELRDKNGTVQDKNTARMQTGMTLDIEVGDYTVLAEVDTLEQYHGASTMNDLLPYANAETLGENHTLVVPIIWADQTEMATEETLMLYKKALGRIEDANGKITDYSEADDEEFSLSEYYDMASYGQYEVNSFITDWYYSEETFAESANRSPERTDVDEILAWVKKTYPDLDWSRYDQDGNGYVDAMIIINAGVSDDLSFSTVSYRGAFQYRSTYYGEYAGTQDDPTINCFVAINHQFLSEGNNNVLCHEYAHNLGLIDYYDVTYSGVDAVGRFDMQSANVGDWNAYSKLAAGWMNPQVVEGLKSGESVELTIQSMALENDVIVIPAAGNKYDGPFGEYIMIDLFSDDGLNQYDAKEFGLSGVEGVRISHVDARMEKRTMEIESQMNLGEKSVYDIGTVHYANDYVDDGKGYYNIEVIQAGKKNTFTDLNNQITTLSSKDLFHKGDSFSVEEYQEFFYNGLMDDGKEFGYTISIVDLGTNKEGTPSATIKITAK